MRDVALRLLIHGSAEEQWIARQTSMKRELWDRPTYITHVERHVEFACLSTALSAELYTSRSSIGKAHK